MVLGVSGSVAIDDGRKLLATKSSSPLSFPKTPPPRGSVDRVGPVQEEVGAVSWPLGYRKTRGGPCLRVMIVKSRTNDLQMVQCPELCVGE